MGLGEVKQVAVAVAAKALNCVSPLTRGATRRSRRGRLAAIRSVGPRIGRGWPLRRRIRVTVSPRAYHDRPARGQR